LIAHGKSPFRDLIPKQFARGKRLRAFRAQKFVGTTSRTMPGHFGSSQAGNAGKLMDRERSKIVDRARRGGNGRRHSGIGGFSLIESVTVLVIIGIVVLIAAPRINRAWSRRDVTAARVGLGSLFLRARVAAVTARRPATLTVVNGMAYVTIATPTGPEYVSQTLLFQTNGVVATSSSTSLTIEPTGLVRAGTPFVVALTKSGIVDSVKISGYGRLE
jgi:prepilin-type N-terminal cleavage/methylation domain-containing protein